jgi:hypothetical protein
MANPTIAPDPSFPERPGTVYERKVLDPRGSYNGARRGPLRFEEGLGTDTDVPTDFETGVLQGYATPPGRPNHNLNVYEKPAAETTKERAHVGSAAWVDSPDLLGEFAGGAFTDHSTVVFEQVTRDGGRQQRQTPAVVQD